MITVAEMQARRAELVEQRKQIDHEIGTIDIRLGLGASREEIDQFFNQPQPVAQPSARVRSVTYGPLVLIVAFAAFGIWVFIQMAN